MDQIRVELNLYTEYSKLISLPIRLPILDGAYYNHDSYGVLSVYIY